MANSAFIGRAKNKIIKEILKDTDILEAIGSDTCVVSKPEDYMWKHIFNYHQDPNTLNTVTTFLTVQVHIPESYYNTKHFVEPVIEIWIISNIRHMRVDNVPKITENRNDYLSRLIDMKFNGRSDFGLGKLTLKSNVEGAFQSEYQYRALVFAGTDINDSLCEDE